MLNKSKFAFLSILLIFCSLASACSAGKQDAGIKSLCEVDGGTLQKVCLTGYEFCVMPYSDGGKPCRSASDCQGRCLEGAEPQAEGISGQCQVNNNPCGCFANIENNQLSGVLCID